jgi:hypothetical protein
LIIIGDWLHFGIIFGYLFFFELDHKISYAGYWIGGFGLGESMDERPALLNAVTV